MSDKIAKALGFQDAKEFFKLCANADISTLEKLAAFKKWKNDDGTKAGLVLLQNKSGYEYNQNN